MSALSQIAKDPSCLLAVDALQGGRWLSCIKPDGVQPSSVQRNFAEEPAIWSDFPMDTGNDFELEISFIIEPAEEIIYSKYIFGSGSKYVYPIRVLTVPDKSNPQNTAIICNIYDGTAPYRAFSLSGTEENFPGKHTTLFNYKAGTLEVYLDGTLKSTRETPLAPQVEFPKTEIGRDVVIFYKSSTGTTWRYPTWEERTRLLTKTNVRTYRGAFEAADETQPARVDTALDLRGKVSSYTVIVDFEAASLVGGQAQQLAGQGPSVGGQTPIASLGYFISGGGIPQLQLAHELNGNRYAFAVALPVALTGRHVACGTIAVGASNTSLSLFLDAELLKTVSPGLKPTGVAYSTYTNYAINDNRDGAWHNYFGKVYAVALFNEALTATEIAAISNKL